MVEAPEGERIAVRIVPRIDVMDADDLLLFGQRTRVAQADEAAAGIERKRELFPSMTA